MLSRIYRTKISNSKPPESTYGEYINKKLTEEEKYSFEYLINTIPEEMLEDEIYNINSSEINEDMVKLLIVLAKFIGNSRDLILEMDNIRDVQLLIAKSIEALTKEGKLSLSTEEVDKVPSAKLAVLAAYDLGYSPNLYDEELIDSIKNVLLNRAVIEKIEVVRAHRGSLAAIKELINNIYILEGESTSSNYEIEEIGLTINIKTYLTASLFRPGTLFHEVLKTIKPAGVSVEFPLIGEAIFYSFAGISNVGDDFVNTAEIVEPYSKLGETGKRLTPAINVMIQNKHANINITNYNTQQVKANIKIRFKYAVKYGDGEGEGNTIYFFRDEEIVETIPAAEIYSKNISNVTTYNKESIAGKVESVEVYLTDTNGNYKSDTSTTGTINYDVDKGNEMVENPLIPVQIVDYEGGSGFFTFFRMINLNKLKADFYIRIVETQTENYNVVAETKRYSIDKYTLTPPVSFSNIYLATLSHFDIPYLMPYGQYNAEVITIIKVGNTEIVSPPIITPFTMHGSIKTALPTLRDVKYNPVTRELTFEVLNQNNFEMNSPDIYVMIGTHKLEDRRNIGASSYNEYSFIMPIEGTAVIYIKGYKVKSPSDIVYYEEDVPLNLASSNYPIVFLEQTEKPTITSHLCEIYEGTDPYRKVIGIELRNNDSSPVLFIVRTSDNSYISQVPVAYKAKGSYIIDVERYSSEIEVSAQASNKAESEKIIFDPPYCAIK